MSDYERAQSLRKRTEHLVVNAPGTVTWIDDTKFWYPRSVKAGTEFMMVDAQAGTKQPAFDHEKLAAAISDATGTKTTAFALPFASTGGRGGAAAGRGGRGPTGALTFLDGGHAIQFGTGGFLYKCTLSDYKCSKGAAVPQFGGGRGGRGPEPPADDVLAAPPMYGGDPEDGLEYLPPSPQQDDAPGFFGRPSGCAPRPQGAQNGAGQGRGGRGAGAPAGFGQAPAEPEVCRSFDGKWDALIENYNVFLKAVGSKEPATALSYDGSEGNHYTLRSIAWSPDSKKLAAYHTRPGYDRQVHYIESSPADQIQPKHTSIFYRKPGDALDIAYPALFDIAAKKEIEIDPALFPNAYSLSTPVWWKDSRAFTFEYNQRGHQAYRVIEVDAQTGKARALVDEQSKTFIYYNPLGPGLSGGRRYRHDVNDGKEIVWASERDGWEHLYLYDGVTGKVKNQITKGDWVVRNIVRVDDDKRQIWFEAGGMNPGQDPYFTEYYRINFDGTGLVAYTQADGNHTVTFSPDHRYYVDSWSRIDLPPVAQLRRTENQEVVMDVDKGDASALLAA
ncbi:MAG TPA: DPP IV N-terminal domain-containing protein, partial [Burkholderiales bacterium]